MEQAERERERERDSTNQCLSHVLIVDLRSGNGDISLNSSVGVLKEIIDFIQRSSEVRVHWPVPNHL